MSGVLYPLGVIHVSVTGVGLSMMKRREGINMARVICDKFKPTEEEMDAGIFYILCHVNWGEVTEGDCERCEFNKR